MSWKEGEEQLDRFSKTLDTVDGFKAGASRARGQGLAEYALILALIAIVAIVALLFLGGQVSDILSNVGKSV